MMEASKVLIVSKTRMRTALCVGGILENGTYVRLLRTNKKNLPFDTKVEIGQICEIEFTFRLDLTAPHNEDILVSKCVYKKCVIIDYDLVQKLGATVWGGDIDGLFDGMLEWTDAGSGFISKATCLPKNSVGFWRPDCDLTRDDYKDGVRFSYNATREPRRHMKYVGVQEAPDIITAGTLLRVSLARWWPRNNEEGEKRCYLQLSGRY